jgi:hypothetical protein
MIEWRWDLAPLTVRDRTASNLAETLDFKLRGRVVPHFAVPEGPFGAPCSLTGVSADETVGALDMAAKLGFPMPK